MYQQPGSQTDLWLAHRKAAGALLDAVFDERATPRYALNHWPVQPEGWEDPSIDAAFQALWHFEADEDKQKTEVFYLDAQLELIKQMASYLLQGKPLPHYLLSAYDKSMANEFYREKKLLDESLLQTQVGWKKLATLFRMAFTCLSLKKLPLFQPKQQVKAGTISPYQRGRNVWGNREPQSARITPFNSKFS